MTGELDLVVTIGLFVSFAALVTVHATLAIGLASCAPRWRALVSLIPPAVVMAPYWGYRAGMKMRAWGWVACALAYASSLVLAYR